MAKELEFSESFLEWNFCAIKKAGSGLILLQMKLSLIYQLNLQ